MRDPVHRENLKTEIPFAKEWIKDGVFDSTYTPDIQYLSSKYMYLPVFVWGQEKHRCSKHRLMRHYPMIGHGWTDEQVFNMYMYMDSEPVILQRPADPSACAIRGELYVVPVDLLCELDHQYQNEYFFKRRLRRITYFDPKESAQNGKNLQTCLAYMYSGWGPEWINRMNKMDLMRPFNSDIINARYYIYTPLNDQRASAV